MSVSRSQTRLSAQREQGPPYVSGCVSLLAETRSVPAPEPLLPSELSRERLPLEPPGLNGDFGCWEGEWLGTAARQSGSGSCWLALNLWNPRVSQASLSRREPWG